MANESMDLHAVALQTCTEEFRKLKRMGERTFAQLADEDFFFRLNPDQNSISVIIKHLSGNMISRWTDFLTSDGEKPNRNRDQEFAEQVVPRRQILQTWEQGWQCVFAAMDSLQPGDLLKTIRIRNEPMTALSAITRQISHYGYHLGQIVLLAKHIKGPTWQYLTIPRGQSQTFNQKMGMK